MPHKDLLEDMRRQMLEENLWEDDELKNTKMWMGEIGNGGRY